jgi:hypothetical protein
MEVVGDMIVGSWSFIIEVLILKPSLTVYLA